MTLIVLVEKVGKVERAKNLVVVLHKIPGIRLMPMLGNPPERIEKTIERALKRNREVREDLKRNRGNVVLGYVRMPTKNSYRD